MAKHDRKGRSKGTLSRFVGLEHYILDSPAWLSLSPVQRCAYIEVVRLYNGMNNGRLAVSGRRLASRLGIHKSTGCRALEVLVEMGFLEITVPGGFSCKVKRATEYRLTAHKCDVTGTLSSKRFMQWGSTKSKARSQK